MDQKAIGQFIQCTRKEKGFTQKELAEKIGVSDKTVSKWETGNGLPDIASLSVLCESLDISINELLAGEKLPPHEYSQKAEENMMNLLKENENVRKSVIFQFIVGGMAAVIPLLIPILSYAGGIKVFIDIPSLIEIGFICVACLLLSGAKGKKNIIGVLRKTVIPAGVMSTLFGIVSILSTIEDTRNILKYISISVISFVYSLLFYLALIVIENRINNDDNSKRQ